MSDVPTIEPLSFRAGDKVQWSRAFDDYPASESYVLKYYLSSESASEVLTASASGDDHLVTIAAATSAGYTPGLYRYSARIEKDTEKYTVVNDKFIQIYPDMSAESTGLVITGANALTKAQQIVFWSGVRANLMDLVDGKALEDNYSYSVGGRSLNKYSFDELIAILDYVERKLVSLKRQIGAISDSTIKVQFG